MSYETRYRLDLDTLQDKAYEALGSSAHRWFRSHADVHLEGTGRLVCNCPNTAVADYIVALNNAFVKEPALANAAEDDPEEASGSLSKSRTPSLDDHLARLQWRAFDNDPEAFVSSLTVRDLYEALDAIREDLNRRPS